MFTTVKKIGKVFVIEVWYKYGAFVSSDVSAITIVLKNGEILTDCEEWEGNVLSAQIITTYSDAYPNKVRRAVITEGAEE